MRRKERQRGAAQIEFILSVILVMFLIFWIWEVVMFVYTFSVLSDAAKEGVRYAVVHGSKNSSCGTDIDCSKTAIENVVKQYAAVTFHNTTAMAVTVQYLDGVGASTPNGSNDPGNRVSVGIDYTYIPYISLNWNPVVHAHAQARIVY